jgi:hypothetical protein
VDLDLLGHVGVMPGGGREKVHGARSVARRGGFNVLDQRNPLLFLHSCFLVFEHLRAQVLGTLAFLINVSKILVVALLHLSFTSPITMAKGSGQGLSLLPPRLQTIGDPEKVWMWPDWTTPTPIVGVRVGSAPLMDQQPNEVVFFTAYALMDLAFPSSVFLPIGSGDVWTSNGSPIVTLCADGGHLHPSL